jgi:legumain
VIARDDIAYNPRNPVKGKIFNKPNGPDVYAGCNIEYSNGNDGPKQLFAVLAGDEAAAGGKRVLKSTANDNVFLYYSDHGNRGLISMPGHTTVYADQLMNALQNMHDKKMYKKLVFYLEACYSGSMFLNILPENLNIYTTTAANERESSYGQYCGPSAVAEGQYIGSCLGDEYSCNWMEDSDVAPRTRTVGAQTIHVTSKTRGSHVQKFGTVALENDSIWAYQGGNNKMSKPIMNMFDDIFMVNPHQEEMLKFNVKS